MFAHTLLLKRKGSVVVSTLLFGWMVLNSSTPALAEKRRDDWNRRSRFSASSNCRNEARRDHHNYQRNNYYSRDNYYPYQRARDYRQDRSYQRYRSNQGRGTTSINPTIGIGTIAAIGDMANGAPLSQP